MIERLLKEMKIKFGVIINQADIGDSNVKQFCINNSVDILMEIPYSRDVAVAYSNGENLLSVFPEYSSKFRMIISDIKGRSFDLKNVKSNPCNECKICKDIEDI